MFNLRGWHACLCLLMLAPFQAPAAQAQSPVQIRTVTIVVGSSSGGGYDLYARLIARYLGRHLPGTSAVVVRNMPGAASNAAANYVYNVAPKDGSVIGALFMGAVVDPLLRSERRQSHDMSRFNYIGNANKDAYVCLVRADAKVGNLRDALSTELVVGASSEGASTRDFPLFMKSLLGLKFKIVSGYPGTREINMALERGEVQGACGETWSSVAATYPDWFSTRLVKPLVQESLLGHADLNAAGVPLILHFAQNAEQESLMRFFYRQAEFGRPYVVAPEVPKDRVELLRKAFMLTLEDPDLVAEASRLKLDIDPTEGSALQAAVLDLYTTPEATISKVRAALKNE